MERTEYMQRALELAVKGKGFTNPNPLVGCVLVKEGRIIGEGYHEYYGGAHAEVNALNRALEDVRGAELYVNLEPCSHYGKTPPCALKIIEKGIRKVYVAMEDPNPKVAGRGIALLREAGIEVELGLLQKEARHLNEIFCKYITTAQPFVTLKTALSLDGKIGLRGRKRVQLTGREANLEAHRLRHNHSAIMVGIGTVLEDDPLLTARIEGEKLSQPVRVIVDSRLRIPLEARVLEDISNSPVVIACTENSPPAKRTLLQERGIELLLLPEKEGSVDLKALLTRLGAMGIDSVLLEGGGRLNFGALSAGIVDKLIFFITPLLLGGETAPTPLDGNGFRTIEKIVELKEMSVENRGRDLMITAYPQVR